MTSSTSAVPRGEIAAIQKIVGVAWIDVEKLGVDTKVFDVEILARRLTREEGRSFTASACLPGSLPEPIPRIGAFGIEAPLRRGGQGKAGLG